MEAAKKYGFCKLVFGLLQQLMKAMTILMVDDLILTFFKSFRDPWYMEDKISITNDHFEGYDPKTYRILITQGKIDPHKTLKFKSSCCCH
ncbi:hypothetical protein PVAND_001251 [Polypedilum vanderplanki]|uniref:Uncharacterized protein n=1 Tax=Polypedilum vanderplanki TaxID=319348 RepID=A0A9J6BMD2_POLVA|nr:hypothetical protein PVAND_001251 [Polypedilum vanderplanki]